MRLPNQAGRGEPKRNERDQRSKDSPTAWVVVATVCDDKHPADYRVCDEPNCCEDGSGKGMGP